MRHTWIILLLALAALSGCLSETVAGTDGETHDTGSDTVGFDADAGPEGQSASGSQQAHGEPTIREGEVDSGPDGGLWKASQTIRIDNDFGGADRSIVQIAQTVGDVVVRPSPDGDYHYVLELVGMGTTQQEAEASLDSIDWSHDDDLADGTLHLTTTVKSDLQTSVSCSIVIMDIRICTGTGWTATLVAELPPGPSHSLSIDTSSADIAVSGLGGSRLVMDSSSGDATVSDVRFGTVVRDASSGDTTVDGVQAARLVHDSSSGDLEVFGGTVDSVRTETSSGDVTMELRIRDLTHSSSSGDLVADLVPRADGGMQVSTSSGDVTIDLAPGAAHGYHIIADTSSGDIDVDVEDGDVESEDEDHMEVRTSGFNRRDIRTSLSIDTSSGDITVEA